MQPVIRRSKNRVGGLEFMEKLYHHMGWSTKKLHENPAFAEVIKEKEA